MSEPMTPLEAPRLSDALWRRLVRLLGRKRFGNGSGTDVVNWAVDALVAGWESSALAVLAGLDKPPNDFEVDNYVERMLRELCVEMPDGERLAKLYAAAVAGDVLARTTSPYDAAKELYYLWLNTGCPKDLQPWAGFEDEYELARDGVYGDVAEVERDIRDEAQRVVDRGV